VVTGAASGIGLAVSRRLVDRGASVALLDVDAGGAERAADDLRTLRTGEARVVGVAADVSDRASVEKALDRVRGEFGTIGIMVTSAGITGNTPFADISVAEWERIITVNLTGTFHCLQLVVRDMMAAGWGRIVTISSSSAQSGAPTMAHYSASKGGVIALTKTLALELAPHGITVNTIPPRAIDTPLLRRSPTLQRPGASIDQMAARSPVGRMGTPEDVAAACDFLCSEDASYITGQVIGVNGGGYI
jgi:NAD(P)-dependent dehydrogenase (short-subunit alcohol dehydrogenase family)